MVFGNIAEMVGSSEIKISNVNSKDELIKALNAQFPTLSGTKYVVAVDRKISMQNDVLNEQTEIALIPPYSGG